MTLLQGPSVRVNALIGTGHFLSHFYQLCLPPMFLAWQSSFGVSFTELGLSIALMSCAAGLLQTPVGFLVDRYGEFVLLKPRFAWHTALLWLGPPGLLLGGALLLLVTGRRRSAAVPRTAMPIRHSAMDSIPNSGGLGLVV